MITNRPDLIELCFKDTYEGDVLTFTCLLCGEQAVFTLHAHDDTIQAELAEHLRGAHRVTQPIATWEEG